MIGKLVHYWGHVQGVGFRYTVLGIARGYAVSGYVKNLPDGQVELWAEGEANEVDRFLEDVAQRMADNIEGTHVSDIDPKGLTSFNIES